MRTIDIVERLRAKRASGGWMTRCPAHGDRLPSLSIREGRDGRTLVRCFAGCDPSAIMHAVGLSLSDLFTDDRPRNLAEPSRRLSADDIQRELQVELERIMADDSQRCDFDVVELPRYRNEARSIIERRFDVQLKREPTLWWQIDPHAVDPVWKICVEQAIRVTAARSDQGFGALARTIADLPQTQHRVLLLARRFQRELAQPITAQGVAA
jgi:hypothetical protein